MQYHWDMNKKELFIKTMFWTLWTVVVAVCAFFIVHNAQWGIGDDHIVIRHTGFGKPFLPSDTVSPSEGRFYPLAYLVYNILLFFGGDHISPTAHYALQAAFFIVFAVSVTILLLKLLEGQRDIWKYTIAFSVFAVFVGRVYVWYTECFSVAWCIFSVLTMCMLFTFLFYEKQKWIYGILALLFANYLCYCGESNFVLLLSFGGCSLLFQRKTSGSKEKVFNGCMVGSALLFLALYAILILPNIESAYDGAHGEDVGIIGNAVRMLLAQKLLLLALVLLVIRMFDILRNKKDYTVYDNLLLTAAVCCCANFVLKLNWTLYYILPALLVIPSILHFSMVYLKEKWVLLLFVLLALFYGRKIPAAIQDNQKDRVFVATEVNALSVKIKEADAVYWYSPEAESSFMAGMRDWRHQSLCTYLGWLYNDKSFSIVKEKEFCPQANSIWLVPSENEALFPDDIQVANSGEKVFDAAGIRGYRVL
jgi:hypothetical protein